ncbi:Daunorubicin/doxorubicin resistance ATP-binding protein DrrA [Aquisphaera giovannonii]|uniref:Daunorubicin/doxorubicin resistance ATP-binding protein DrrA n=1 Tax=Aquisphaera giovannonii TaxID=406548 RepID=A0A5B9VTP9_9BACT|nr:ABC transporter ATP-binding protein [Aquisphaera giovannonii]QEH31668.1 Daunorubicin/doxorubicin resistance ATP-binding protein DrrA [Aquisphaera giovannonii]
MHERSGPAVLEVSDLTKVYGGRPPMKAVDGLSFDLRQGEALGLLGPNGAGKTTTIQMLLSTLTPTSGEIAYFGRSLRGHRDFILSRVGYASAYAKLPTHLTILENLDVFGRLSDMGRADRAARSRELLTRFGVWELRDRIMTGLSAGQTTRVMLAKAFLARPRVVLLDEPTASLDPDIAHEVRTFVTERRDREGVSLLYTSHDMDEVAMICDRVLFLDRGRLAAIGPPAELAASAAATKVRLRAADAASAAIIREEARAGGLSARPIEPHADAPDEVEIEMDEPRVAPFLAALARRDASYSEIHLDKPTLEDYFLKIARRSGTDRLTTEAQRTQRRGEEKTETQ